MMSVNEARARKARARERETRGPRPEYHRGAWPARTVLNNFDFEILRPNDSRRTWSRHGRGTSMHAGNGLDLDGHVASDPTCSWPTPRRKQRRGGFQNLPWACAAEAGTGTAAKRDGGHGLVVRAETQCVFAELRSCLRCMRSGKEGRRDRCHHSERQKDMRDTDPGVRAACSDYEHESASPSRPSGRSHDARVMRRPHL